MMTMNTILRPIDLLPRAKATDHPISMLVRMLLSDIVAPIARVHLRAAAESEPPIAFGVVFATAASWQLLARDNPKVFLWSLLGERAALVTGSG
jgi:hypothetical protein